MMAQPILIISDAASCSSGLGRITRDLAKRIYDLPQFRVATAGYGGAGDDSFPWTEYHFHSIDHWQLPELPEIAQNFADELIILTIWDASRLLWMAEPQRTVPSVRKWLATAKIKKWGYFPVDAEGPNGGLSVRLKECMAGFDRVLNYTPWSAGVTGYPDWLPHGIDTSVFQPRDKAKARRQFMDSGFIGLTEDSFLVGIVGTNQSRKDWALGIQTVRKLLDRGLDVKLWAHIDVLERFWNIVSLIEDYGLQGRVAVTTSNFTDEQMSWLYSACDVTLGIGLGEGFRFPCFESLACGTPCIHGNYGGAACFMPKHLLVEPIAWHYESPFCNKRPVFKVEDWADLAQAAQMTRETLPPELDWNNLWPGWKKWLEAGLQ